MTILIVSEMSVPYAVGGGEMRYALLARELARRGHSVTWLSMRQKESPGEETIDGVRHLHRGPRIESPPCRPLLAKLCYMVTAFWHLLTHRYDVIDCQTYAPLPAVWLACLLSGQRMVATIHDTSSRRSKASIEPESDDQWLSARDRLLIVPVEKLLYRLPYWRVVTDTYGIRETLAEVFGVSRRNMTTVHCGIDTESIAAASPAAQRVDVIFVGRIVPHKHIDDFLRMVATVGQRRRDRGLGPVVAAVVGDGPRMAEMKSLAQSLGLSEPMDRNLACQSPATIEFTGPLADHGAVMSRIKSARVLVLPSTREGFGLVLAEAMACGTPCVAYDVPAVREVVADGEAGMLVPCREVEALATAVDRILENQSLRSRLINAGRHRVAQCFAAATFAERMEAVYRGR